MWTKVLKTSEFIYNKIEIERNAAVILFRLQNAFEESAIMIGTWGFSGIEQMLIRHRSVNSAWKAYW